MRKLYQFQLLCLCGITVFVILRIIESRRNYSIYKLKTSPVSNPLLFRPSIQPLKCSDSHQVLLIVTSYVGHVELRSAHRRSMPWQYLEQYNTMRVFLLAQIPQVEISITQNAVVNESRRFNDILQGSFIENYRNLTYKHLMGLDWAANACASAKFVIKVDDDTVFNYEKVHSLLKQYNASDKFIVGYELNGTKPHREKQNKWFVSYEEYPHETYPNYVSGWLYITTLATVSSLVKASAYHSYFWIDDIFITGILASELNIEIINLKRENIWLEYYELMECCLRDMIKKNIKCEYAISPNGGRNNLIYEFNKALSHCKASDICKNRSGKQDLKKSCIVQAERTLFGQGESHVKVVHL